MAGRLQLQDELERILGTSEVYYQPPESKKLKYPCIIYEIDDTYTRKADNKNYIFVNRYHIKHLFKSNDNDLRKDLLDNFEMMTHDNRMVVDGLYNDDFTLYY